MSKWVREIQKVTKLDRDPSNGTALQEISFWLNLERALLRIQEKRESVEVSLTLEVLKHGKRFHATVSFEEDTGLKQVRLGHPWGFTRPIHILNILDQIMYLTFHRRWPR